MPEPVAAGRRYIAGLDGLRAVAVLAVVAYHLGFGWARGGLLGVGVFFTLSGYLITDLLLTRMGSGRPWLGQFWLARARRLLPALVLMIAVVSAWVALVGPMPSRFGLDAAGGLLYVSNWQLILEHASYFDRFGPPSPLEHLWSLGIEEQFYLAWPLLLLLAMRVLPERPGARGIRPRLAAVTVVAAALSTIQMALLFSPSLDPSRVYFGTDTRAFQLLAGAALAMVWPSGRLRGRISRSARTTLDVAGAGALAVILGLLWRASGDGPLLYHGGFVAATLATVVLIAVIVHPGARIGSLLGIAPLRWVGVRSYGIYLWHIPVIVLTAPMLGQPVGLRQASLQLVATFCLAALSWRLVEEPIRRGALGRLRSRMRMRMREGSGAHASLPRPSPANVAWATSLAAVLVLAVGLVGTSSARNAVRAAPVAVPAVSATFTAKGPYRLTATRSASGRPARTRCRAVLYIGDSTSVGLISPSYIPNAWQRIPAQLARVGVRTRHIEISGARSIVETYRDEPNAYDVARQWKDAGFSGCWVFALGTNDTANVAVGSGISRLTRIRRMMSLVGGSPVLWVDVKSLRSTGPYADANMRAWNDALRQACRARRNMWVYDWAGDVRDGWFGSDGIHYGTPGYVTRSRLIANALRSAFPDGEATSTRRCALSALHR